MASAAVAVANLALEENVSLLLATANMSSATAAGTTAASAGLWVPDLRVAQACQEGRQEGTLSEGLCEQCFRNFT